jgi:aldehyde dehydrogenase (NAD+)
MKGTYGAVEVPAPDLAKSTQGRTGEGFAQDLFEKQKAYFATDVTKTYEWRIDQLDRLSRMLKENNERFFEASRRDFKTALPENIFEVSATIASIEFTKSQLKEWMKPVEAPIPKFLAESGHKGIVYREPYGVTLIICPFNALRRSRKLRHRELLRQVWVRFPHACQVNPCLPARRSYRSPISAVHHGECARAQSVV